MGSQKACGMASWPKRSVPIALFQRRDAQVVKFVGGRLHCLNLLQVELIAGIFLPVAVARMKGKPLRFQFPLKVLPRGDDLSLHQPCPPKPCPEEPKPPREKVPT